MIEVSVVMPTFNRRDSLAVVLPSLAGQDYPKDRYEIILVDNGSTDGTDELVKGLGIPNLRHIVQENSGRSGARNRGIREASGGMVMFTDADIIAEPDLISSHMAFLADRPNSAVVGREVQVNTLEERDAVKAGTAPERTLHKASKKRLPWYFFLTGNAAAPKDALIEVGMFDESFTGYGHEDIELGYRLAKAGIPIYYNHGAVNYHWHPVEFEEQCSKMRLAGISTVRFYNKHRDPEVKLRLGFTPASMLFYGSFSLDGSVMRLCRARKDKSRLCRDIVLQRNYTEGIREGLRKLGR